MKERSSSLGANSSHYDSRTYRHDTTLAAPLIKGGVSYLPIDILDQHSVGICTAISLVQNAEKALGQKFSYDFQYLCQKKFYDLNWFEGSSIFNSLKVGKNIGFLPAELWTYTTEADTELPYSVYIAKLQAIPDAEVQRLIGLCVHKLAGYASVATDSQSLAKGILDSKAGVLCRFDVGSEWWTAVNGTVSYDTKDIDPLRPPKQVISGHAIGSTLFDYTLNLTIELANTWGTTWDMQGRGHTNLTTYAPTEAWIPYYDTVPQPLPPQYVFTQDMKYGDQSEDVRQLQIRLGVQPQTGFYGDITSAAVLQYQIANISLSWWERYVLRGHVCGPKTRAKLNG